MLRPADVNLLTVLSDGHHYIFLFNDANRQQVVKTMGRWAADQRLNFSWADAGILARRVNQAPPVPAVDPEHPF